MAFLRNSNGANYEIISSRPSKYYKGHNDYVVRLPKSGGITIAHGWKPAKKEWEHSEFYGWDNSALKVALKDFKSKK